MYSSTILPNFRKLQDYNPLTAEQITAIEELGGVHLELDYMDEVEYLRFAEGLKTIATKFGLEDHYTELLYLILKQNEHMRVLYDAYWDNYNDDLTSREVAKILLAYKTSDETQNFHLSIKTFTDTVTLKDSAIARWMMEEIYNKIEAGEFPLGLFGVKIVYNLFGDEFGTAKQITDERLKATANLSPRKPTVKLKKLYTEFCLYIQLYLINQTHLTIADGVLLTDAHANFFFDVLELIGYLNRDKIESEPKDYIHAMFNNYIKK
ncbi:MAG: hypothetical protein EOO90_05290 [Pedobacter sp.]|nr:MAG: hypothetical protein EOO90_05290 [Pedobacter sp.]